MRLRPLLACLALICLPSLAGGPLRLGTVAVAPYGMDDAHGEADGIFYQLASRIAQQAGLPFRNALYPTGRLYAMLTHREIDLAVSSRQLDRDLGLVNLGKIWQLEGIILYRASLPMAPKQIGDFKPYSIGRLPGTCPTLARSGMQLYELADFHQGLRMLAAGRVDGLCGDRNSLSYLLAHTSDANMVTRSFTFLTSDVWVFASPTLDAATQAKLRTAADGLLKSGEAQKLIERYIPANPSDRRSTPP